MTAYRRADVDHPTKPWVAHLKWRDEQGRVRQMKRSFRTRSEAQKWERSESLELRSAPPPNTDVTLEEWLDEWLGLLRGRGLRATTITRYASDVRTHVVPHLGSKKLASLTARDLDGLLSGLARSRSRRLSLRSVRLVYATLHKALNDAVKVGLIRVNPSNGCSPPTLTAVRNSQRPPHFWSLAEISRFLEVSADMPIYGPLFRTTLLTGLRRGEVCGLHWVDVDFTTGVITVRRSRVVVDGETIDSPPKTRFGFRKVSLDEVTLQILKELRKRTSSEFVFVDCDGRPLKPDTVSQNFAAVVNRAGLPPIRFHDLRHSHASALLELGVNMKAVSERLGHADVGFTLSTYAHLSEHADRDSARRLSDALDGPTGASR